MNVESILGVARTPKTLNIYRVVSLFFEIVGLAIVITAAVLLVPSLFSPSLGYILFLLPALFVLGSWFITTGKRLRALRATEVMLLNPDQAPVLYLRSFSIDTHDEGSTKTAKVHEKNIREEEILASIFSNVGPFVAIGDPTEVLPKLGAHRAYLGMDNWQRQVEQIMRSSSLVLLRVSDTPGFQWEAATAVRSLPPEKILFYFSQTLNAENLWKSYLALRKCINEYLPIQLSVRFEMNNERFLRFEKDWTPVLFGQLARSPEPLHGIGERMENYFAKLGLSRLREKRLERLSLALRPFFAARDPAPGSVAMFSSSTIRMSSLLSGPLTAGTMMAFNFLRVQRPLRALATLTLNAGLAVALPFAAWLGWYQWGDVIANHLRGREMMGLLWGAWILLFFYFLFAQGLWVTWTATSIKSVKQHLAFGGARVHTTWSTLLILFGAGLWWSYVALVFSMFEMI